MSPPPTKWSNPTSYLQIEYWPANSPVLKLYYIWTPSLKFNFVGTPFPPNLNTLPAYDLLTFFLGGRGKNPYTLYYFTTDNIFRTPFFINSIFNGPSVLVYSLKSLVYLVIGGRDQIQKLKIMYVLWREKETGHSVMINRPMADQHIVVNLRSVFDTNFQ